MKKQFFIIALGALLLNTHQTLSMCGKAYIRNYTDCVFVAIVNGQVMRVYGKGEKPFSGLTVVGKGNGEISLGVLREAVWCGLRFKYLSPLFTTDDSKTTDRIPFKITFDRTAGDIPTLVIKEIALKKHAALKVTKENWS